MTTGELIEAMTALTGKFGTFVKSPLQLEVPHQTNVFKNRPSLLANFISLKSFIIILMINFSC